MEDSAETVELRELAAHASHYAALLRAGKRIAIADEEGEVMGYLVPPEKAHLTPADKPNSPFERLVAAGQVRPATGNLLDHLEPAPAEPGEEPLGDLFLRWREEERY